MFRCANFAILPDEALSEIAAATNEHSSHTKSTICQKILVGSLFITALIYQVFCPAFSA